MGKALAIIGVVVVIGAGAFLFMRSDSDGPSFTSSDLKSSGSVSTNAARNNDGVSNANTNTQASEESDDSDSTFDTITDLLASGSSMKCEFAVADQNGAQEWDMYVDGKKFRGDYAVDTTDDSEWNGHTLRDDEYMYNWGTSNGQTYGTKIKLSALEDLTTSTGTAANTNTNSSVPELDYDESVDMDCDRWNADASQFVPPSDVTFMDLTAQLEQVNAIAPEAKAAQCGACDAVSDDVTREQCRQALGC